MVALLIIVCLCFTAVAVRLIFVQGLSADRYAAIGASQRLRSITLPAERGTIFDRNGRELALSVPQKTVWADPRQVMNPVATASALAPLLGQDEAFLRERLNRDAAFVYLARKVDDRVAKQVGDLGLAGINLMAEPKRFWPAGSLATPLLGQVGTDNIGLSGLELQFDRQLAGRPGQLVVERDPAGQEIAAGVRQHRAARRGDDLVLTIDRSLQYETERLLDRQIAKANAKGGVAVVMDPRTGEILAMANLTVDSSGKVGPASSNVALTAAYEPGSVNKVITLAAALEEGLYRPTDALVVPGSLQVADHRFSESTPHPTKRWLVADVLAKSSNVGTIMIGRRLGEDRIDRYLREFGFGSETGLGFPGESAGLLVPPEHWSGTSIGTVPIGQGLAVTAVQMLAVYNTVANDGMWVEPTLVKATVDSQGRQQEAPPPKKRRVISVRTAGQVTAMLERAVTNGTGTAAAIEGYAVAGKTGTARKPREGARGYKPGAYVASFAGFAPAQSPRLSSIVILDEPTPIYGGLVAAPVFADMTRYGLRLFEIPPSRPAGAIPSGANKRSGGLDAGTGRRLDTTLRAFSSASVSSRSSPSTQTATFTATNRR